MYVRSCLIFKDDSLDEFITFDFVEFCICITKKNYVKYIAKFSIFNNII
jgi:hypothetical protein